MIQPLLSLKRLFFDETAGKVRYHHSRHGSQKEPMDYLEFIVRVTSQIPDKGRVMIRYYGLFSNAHRGKMRKDGVGPPHPPIIEDKPAYVPAKDWTEMIRKVYEFVRQEILITGEESGKYFRRLSGLLSVDSRAESI